MKLELKHIAPYLPYNLKLTWPCSTIDLWYGNMHEVIDRCQDSDSSRWVPILHPLSEITERNATESLRITNDSDIEELINCIRCDDVEFLRHDIFMLLVEKHYDVFNLIQNKLAININTLK